MKAFKRAILEAALLISIISVAYAAILVQKQIPAPIRIKPTCSMEIYDTDGTTLLASIPLGDFTWNTYAYFPGKTLQQNPDLYYLIKNNDQVDFYVQFQVADFPEGVTVYVWLQRLDQPEPAKDKSPGYVYPYPLLSQYNNPDPNVQAAKMWLLVSVNQPAFGSYNPYMIFNAVDTPQG